MSSKAKRVLPTRPEPPSLEQILADLQSTHPGDTIFLLPSEPSPEHSSGEPRGGSRGQRIPAEEERERLYRLSRRYLGMNQQLQEAQERLRAQREELLRARAALESDIEGMRQKAC
ncbi:CS025 protein, partial [Psilopogon haemacephalus]|nr:CS025 protein [Psilopogon haemacephalus]